MTYVRKPTLRQVAETQDTAVLTALADRLDIALNSIHNAAARRAVMNSRAVILAAQKQLNP